MFLVIVWGYIEFWFGCFEFSGLNPIQFVINAKHMALQAAPEDFRPYRSRIFSLHGALRYTLPISHDMISKPFSAVMRNAIWMLSLETTLE